MKVFKAWKQPHLKWKPKKFSFIWYKLKCTYQLKLAYLASIYNLFIIHLQHVQRSEASEQEAGAPWQSAGLQTGGGCGSTTSSKGLCPQGRLCFSYMKGWWGAGRQYYACYILGPNIMIYYTLFSQKRMLYLMTSLYAMIVKDVMMLRPVCSELDIIFTTVKCF